MLFDAIKSGYSTSPGCCLVRGRLRCRWTLDTRCHKEQPIDQIRVASQSLDDSTQFQIPDDNLRILASAGNKSVALADIDVCNEIKMTM